MAPWRRRAALAVLLLTAKGLLCGDAAAACDASPDVADAAAACDASPDVAVDELRAPLSLWSGAPPAASALADASALRLEPRQLVLEKAWTCMPAWQVVEIVNAGSREITVEGATSDHQMFTPYMPKRTVLRLGEACKMRVLVVAQSVGQFEGVIYVHTSQGLVPYTVRASAEENDYRVEPIVGAKVVVGERFSAPVMVHNPHGDSILVQEVATDEDFLHLAQPVDRPPSDGGPEGQSLEPETAPSFGNREFWTVLPGQHRPLVYVTFLSHIPKNSRATSTSRPTRKNSRFPWRSPSPRAARM
ncbi:unnamed protein product [Prorocentrum cordatum]|uniref:TMEM131 second Ig-like domain-containing protein n=1 Tax=Prorocentrum cordatum TaxID=2364126 RepID=A0ABN9UCT4_9DINO|nr:unnamed protein product [Polarella glacialis]